MLTASAPSGEMMTWINPSAIEQLRREVDALKVKAAPTPAAPTPEPSAELVALRARCERLAVVARWAEKARYAVSWPHQLGSALDALHPDDTEAK
jgi:hypothetical protein